MEMHELDGKVAIVTGAARGRGYAIAEKFLTEGTRVLLVDINDEACGRAVEYLEMKLRNRASTRRIDGGTMVVENPSKAWPEQRRCERVE